MLSSTGVARLDMLLRGGVPAGLLEISGHESCGKTVLAASILREASGPTVWISLSGLPERQWLIDAGAGDAFSLLPGSGEAAIDGAGVCLRQGARVVVLDNFAHLDCWPGRSLLSENWQGRKRLAHHGLRALTNEARRTGSLVVVVNELRRRPGSGFRACFDAEISACRATRLLVTRKKYRTNYDEFAYLQAEVTLRGHPTMPPGGKATFVVFRPGGVSRELSLLSVLQEAGILCQKGAYWCGEDRTLGPGYAEAIQGIRESYNYWKEQYEHRSDRQY